MLNIIIQPLLAILIIFSCLSYGNVDTFGLAISQTIVALSVLCWLMDMAAKGKIVFVKTGFSIFALLFLLFVFFQLIPLPRQFIRILSPHAAYLYDTYVPKASAKPFFPLSICPHATRTELLKALAYGGLFLVVLNALQKRRHFSIVVNTIIFFGTCISVFGIIQKFTYSGRVYWFDAAGSAGSPFGPFVNRNNFAGYINMVIPLAAGYFFVDAPLSKRVVYGLCFVVMSIALFLSASRAGMLVYFLACVFMLLCARIKESLRPKIRILAIWLAVIFLLFSFLINTRSILERLSTFFAAQTFVVFGHGYSWWDIIRIWSDYPLFGTGLGTFGSIAALYKTTASQNLFIYAHNDYLQLLSETGLIGMALLVSFFALYCNSLRALWKQRHDSYAVGIVLGGMTSLFGMFIYSFLDFNLHIPANAFLFFIIMAATYRLSATRFNHAVTK